MAQGRIRLYDTLAGGPVELRTREPGVVHMYTCGPTVYNYTHIGHLRPALVADVLARHLTARGYKVVWVSNFTDVDDRIIDRANAEGIAPTALSQRYIDDYLSNLQTLGVTGITRFVRVTDHIPDIVAMVQDLVDKGFAYPVDGDVYFAVESKADYGKLSGRTLGDMRAGARVEVDERKRHPMDFALWKAVKPGEPSWPSPWGQGRPGWHIECSAMSLRYLGDGFDIHGGGSDLIFPHHENEIAQSEAFTGHEPFVRIWLHNAMVQVDGEKISKSLGNFIPLRDLVESHPTGALRYFVLSTHYRKPLQFSEHALAEARKAWTRLCEARRSWRTALGGQPALQTGAAAGLVRVETVDAAAHGDAPDEKGAAPAARDLRDLNELAQACAEAFGAALDDDLNTSGALGQLFELVRAGNAALAGGEAPDGLATALEVLDRCGDQLGLWEAESAAVAADVYRTRAEELVRLLVEIRAEARSYRDWAMADRIRGGLAGAGVVLEDTPSGTNWRWEEPEAEPVAAKAAEGGV